MFDTSVDVAWISFYRSSVGPEHARCRGIINLLAGLVFTIAFIATLATTIPGYVQDHHWIILPYIRKLVYLWRYSNPLQCHVFYVSLISPGVTKKRAGKGYPSRNPLIIKQRDSQEKSREWLP